MAALPEVKVELEEFLCSPQNLPIHGFRRRQRFWPRVCDLDKLYNVEMSPLHSYITWGKEASSGMYLECYEEAKDVVGLTSKNSTSLHRAPVALSLSVKGEPTNYPFWPGGFEVPMKQFREGDDDLPKKRLVSREDFLTCPPGFKKGMTFTAPSPRQVEQQAPSSVLDFSEVYFSDIKLDLPLPAKNHQEDLPPSQEVENEADMEQETSHDFEVEDITKIEQLRKDESKPAAWAVKVTESVEDIPRMAHAYPFPLDNFQKQAIQYLEKHENVFVAAHTSAGKTVVAEYAIALSQKHNTRVIYTSPIKALSNQKFRDFRSTFGEGNIGLLTGDVQLRADAPCLIMTTEILRSMLYNGSDVIRDVEWVIFDEIHYINDSERGVVWEEVVIMLPQHIGVIMLSATVPNAMKFADWVGRTKKKKIHVVTTLKRPVPLRHYLYTGHNKQTCNELFEIVLNTEINQRSYHKAITALKERSAKAFTQYGSSKKFINPKQEKNIWMSLIHSLQLSDKLPVVAFTFSRNRCDDNANSLSTTDLLPTALEKSKVHVFFERSILRLKGSDSKLPQIIWMRDLLKRGIAVHHSGILPILKEVVELLFQKGFVKLLFATETFAIGVNMPARTVVFDSNQKYDGVRKRNLNPGEYIQMAGRAGRRGLDESGTVILLCKIDVPEMSDLKNMILGKPTSLESQFRLTYSMLLNLMRVDTLRVEDMMKRSFAEINSAQDESSRLRSLHDLKMVLGDSATIDCDQCVGSIQNYYMKCSRMTELHLKMQVKLMEFPQVMKSLGPGRVVTIYLSKYLYTLALVVQMASKNVARPGLVVLMLCNEADEDESIAQELIEQSAKDMKMVQQYQPLKELYLPESPIKHAVVNIPFEVIFNIADHVLEVDCTKIVNDYKKRQIPRFRADPPTEACAKAVLMLTQLVKKCEISRYLDPVQDLRIHDIDFVSMLQERRKLEASMEFYDCIHCPAFNEHFVSVSERLRIKNAIHELQFELSERSLQLFPEYQKKVLVLKELSFISDSGVIELKGRVACELHTQVVLITEILFQNVMAGLEAAEIVALLSCVVFQQANCSKPVLNETLQKGKNSIMNVSRGIAGVERQCGLDVSDEDALIELKFGLTEVVYEWAKGEAFVEVIKRTDVSEGMIVRCIQRLDETCKTVRNAARVIGDSDLLEKMETASTLIRRDIVFAASLYLQ